MQKLLIALSILISSSVIAQTEEYKLCDADSMYQIAIKNDPGILVRRQKFLEFAKQFGESQQRVTTPGGVLYTIPIVFHVMHNYGSENITKQQILDAVDVLNLSFQKLNADTVDVIPTFQPIFANSQIRFRLANIDPNGNCTDGITRTQTTLTYAAGQNLKPLDDWRNDRYLNIWVVQRIASGAAGYSNYPGVQSDIEDGVEILSSYVIGPNGGNYTSRSLTHEVGHYLGLPHTWGNSNSNGLPSNCSIDDGIDDTPNCAGSNPSACNLSQNSCITSPIDSIDNVQNYMDYASCHKMFTEGQKMLMHASLNSSIQYRSNLGSQANLIATGTEDGHVASVCVPKADFSNKKIAVCEGSTVTFNDKSWRGDATSWQWDFMGGTPATSFAQNPTVQYNVPGTYEVRLIATNSAGSDTLIRPLFVTVLPDTGTNSIPYTESFETITIPGNDWFIDNEGTSNAFAITSTVGATGTHSVRLLNQSGNAAGNTDVIITPSYNLTTVSGTMMTFKYAFAAKNITDSSFLKVYVSNDCGQTWNQKVLKSSPNLQTAPVSTSSFVPTAAQWATQTINLSATLYSGRPSFRAKFEYWQDRGNNLYIDDININGNILGVNEILAEEFGVSIHPNPVHGSAVLEMELKENAPVAIDLYDVLGKKVSTIAKSIFNSGKHKFEILNKNYEGVYFVRLNINNNVFNQKIVFVK